MQRRNLDFEIPLTRDQWELLGRSASGRPDDRTMEWTPVEFDVIHVSIRTSDAPPGWEAIAPPEGAHPDEREVALFVYNDGRPYAKLEPPAQPAPPAVQAEEDARMQTALEHWVRDKWHGLLIASGVHGTLPPDEPNPPHR